MRLTRSILPKNRNGNGPTRSVFTQRSKRKICDDDIGSLSKYSIDDLLKEVLRRLCDPDNNSKSTKTKKLLDKIKLAIPGCRNDPKPKLVGKINLPNGDDPMVDYLENVDTVYSDEESEYSHHTDDEKDEDTDMMMRSYSDEEDRDSIPSSNRSSDSFIDLDTQNETACPLEERRIMEGEDHHVVRSIEFVATSSHIFEDGDNQSEDDRDEYGCEQEDFDDEVSENSSIESSCYTPMRNRVSGDDVDCCDTISTCSGDSDTVIQAPRMGSRVSPRPKTNPLVVMNNDRRNMLAWTRCAARNRLQGGSTPFPIAYPKDETADEESPSSSHTSQNNNDCCCCFLG